MTTYSVACSSPLHEQAVRHLLRSDGQEDLCFALWHPSQGRTRLTALVQELILPRDDERRVHGNASFLPNYFERALGAAVAAGAGLAFLHSHGGPGWQDLSQDDFVAEQRHAGAVYGATGLPLVGLTLGTDGAWSARFWERAAPRTYTPQWCSSVRVVGERLDVTANPKLTKAPAFRQELTRTVSAWGPGAQRRLARLRVGVVGAGSVGSMIGEALARMGITQIRTLDFDSIEVVNLDRQLHATRWDVRLRRSKVEVLARGLRRGATAYPFTVDALEWSVVEEEGFREALDCDVLFSCVDRPWPRSVMNFIAYAHLIPVVDGGIYSEALREGRGLRHADWRAHIAVPTRRCLECLGQYDPGLVSAERDGYLDDPHYIAGLPDGHPARRNENVFAFSLSTASFEVLQFLAMVVAPAGLGNAGAQMYHFFTATLETNRSGCNENCVFPSLIALGDHAGVVLTGRHRKAEEAREQRTRQRRTWSHQLWRFAGWLSRVMGWES